MKYKAITFDFGQTLADLDYHFLSRRLSEREVVIGAEVLEAAHAALGTNPGLPGGWRAFMSALLRGAGLDDRPDVVEWLYGEQPSNNLWRIPVPGMFELLKKLKARWPLAVISNSEGKVRELARELGCEEDFVVIADSGVLGIEKPDPRIFLWTAAQLGLEPADIVHVGDSFVADVQGARDAGFQAVHFRGPEGPHTADELYWTLTSS